MTKQKLQQAWPASPPSIEPIEVRRAFRVFFRHRLNKKDISNAKWFADRNYVDWSRFIWEAASFFSQRQYRDYQHVEIIKRDLQSIVLKRGWLTGRLKSRARPKMKPTPDARQEARRKRLEANLKRWRTKATRAENAIAKIGRQLKAIERDRKKKSVVDFVWEARDGV